MFHRQELLLKIFIIAFGIAMLFTGYLNDKSWNIQNLGEKCYTMKILDGLFFTGAQGNLCLISGTEAPEGSESQVFIYDIDTDEIIAAKNIDNASCILAFCETSEDIFFATIAREEKEGCDLYSWNKINKEFRHCTHFQEAGIYSIVYDGNDKILIGTSFEANLYSYDIFSKNCELICESPTDENYIRSMCYNNGYCYLGIGTAAQLVRVNVRTGNMKNLLADKYTTGESFVYAQTCYDENILLLMSPSYNVLEMDKEGDFEKVGNCAQLDGYEVNEDDNVVGELEGKILIKQGERWKIVSLGYKVGYYNEKENAIYGLNSSGIYEKVVNGKVVFQKDFCEYLKKSYIIPVEVQIYDNEIYFPWRRFTHYNLQDNTKQEFVTDSEPQASIITEEGIYTANYTECTIWFYPFLNKEYEISEESKVLLADIENQCRPHQMDISSDKKYLALGSGPLYGQWGGGNFYL